MKCNWEGGDENIHESATLKVSKIHFVLRCIEKSSKVYVHDAATTAIMCLWHDSDEKGVRENKMHIVEKVE